MSFARYIRDHNTRGTLVVQPRMGMSDPMAMRAGLQAVRGAHAATVGTITLDSYTRVNALNAAAEALARGDALNGYPIASHTPEVTAAVLHGIRDNDFPVQVRHGSARPQHIAHAMARVGLSVTEGGPVSYCLPYSRTPLASAMEDWREFCDLLTDLNDDPHVETFGGCLMGQLCPPSMLVAMSVLEACFLAQRGLPSVSLSYAQQIDPGQDYDAVVALRSLAAELLNVDWHVVIYTYMGLYPRSVPGSLSVLEQSVHLARSTGSERLIVKTYAESRRIPTVAENVHALEHAALTAAQSPDIVVPRPEGMSQVEREARALVQATLELHPDVGQALLIAFERGMLDVPYCLHPDNPGRARSGVDPTGRIEWIDIGGLPLQGIVTPGTSARLTSGTLLDALSTMQRRHDRDQADGEIAGAGAHELAA
ncbi:MAG: methylaspartate mutase [Tetrasphaera sp.]